MSQKSDWVVSYVRGSLIKDDYSNDPASGSLRCIVSGQHPTPHTHQHTIKLYFYETIGVAVYTTASSGIKAHRFYEYDTEIAQHLEKAYISGEWGSMDSPLP